MIQGACWGKRPTKLACRAPRTWYREEHACARGGVDTGHDAELPTTRRGRFLRARLFGSGPRRCLGAGQVVVDAPAGLLRAQAAVDQPLVVPGGLHRGVGRAGDLVQHVRRAEGRRAGPATRRPPARSGSRAAPGRLLPAGPGASVCSSQTPPRSDTRHSQPRAGRIARNQRMGAGSQMPCLTIAGLDELLTPSSTCRS